MLYLNYKRDGGGEKKECSRLGEGEKKQGRNWPTQSKFRQELFDFQLVRAGFTKCPYLWKVRVSSPDRLSPRQLKALETNGRSKLKPAVIDTELAGFANGLHNNHTKTDLTSTRQHTSPQSFTSPHLQTLS